MTSHSLARRSSLLASVAVFSSLVITGCAQTEVAEPTSSGVSSGLQQVEGRAVSASDTELVLRTADSEYTFSIKPEDLAAIDPAHINSHIGVETLGFRVFYRNEGGVDYVVSVQEIKGSTLGFD
jgi:hypothetical protein